MKKFSVLAVQIEIWNVRNSASKTSKKLSGKEDGKKRRKKCLLTEEKEITKIEDDDYKIFCAEVILIKKAI